MTGEVAPTLAAVIGFAAMLSACWLPRCAGQRRTVAPPSGEPTSPPQKLSPAALRFMRRLDCDGLSSVAALLSLAGNGHLEITEEKNTFTLKRGNASEEASSPSQEEKALLATVFARGEVFSLTPENREQVKECRRALATSLVNRFEGKAFLSNYNLFVVGLVILGVTAMAVGSLGGGTSDALTRAGGVALFSIAIAIFLKQVSEYWSINIQSSWHKARRNLGYAALCAAFLAALIFLGNKGPTLWPALVILSIQSFAAVRLRELVKSRTESGAVLAADIDAFRGYLLRGGPQLTLKNLEKIMGYYVALDAEEAYGRVLSDLLHERADTSTYLPQWLKSVAPRPFNLREFAARLDAALDADIID